MKDTKKELGKTNMDILWIIAIFMLWFVVVRFVLPSIGISTWMTTACTPRDREQVETIVDKDKSTSKQISVNNENDLQ